MRPTSAAKREKVGRGDTREGIMCYAAIPPLFHKTTEDAIVPRKKTRNAVEADMGKALLPDL